MYAHCLFCHAHLGSNAAIPALPVGVRLAFDTRLGRLWVVCTACGRWNLTAFEERWEALEQCEHAYRRTRMRYSSGNIALARLRDGSELVRIGKPLRPEFAAWRYGTVLRRWRVPGWMRRLEPMLEESIRRGVAAAEGVADRLPGAARGVDLRTRLRFRLRGARVVTRIASGEDCGPAVRAAHLSATELLRPVRAQPWRLRVRHDAGSSLLEGEAALRIGGRLLAALNGRAFTGRQLHEAYGKLEEAGSRDSYFSRVGALALRTSWGLDPGAPRDTPIEPEVVTVAERVALRLTNRSFWSRGSTGSDPSTPLPRVPLTDRLALEIAVHEESERRALAGEMLALAAAWREAEEIASIADSLVP